MLVSGGSIYVGSSAITEVYKGVDLVWSNGIPAPAWPGNYFYPTVSEYLSTQDISFWKSSLISGHTYNLNIERDDDEGEGGGGGWTIEPKAGSGQYDGSQRYSTTQIVPNKNYQNAWINVFDGWTMYVHSLGDFSGTTAIAFKSVSSYGGHGVYVSYTGVNWNNIVLAVNLNVNNEFHNWRFDNDIVRNCPNLKYICLNIDGTNTGSTITLTGSTAWTADSMKFTEWYCPGTTFIIENNSFWHNVIDWDIAQERNVTFKDGDGNVIKDTSKEYLTIEMLGDGTINFTDSTGSGLTAHYSLNNGTWTSVSGGDYIDAVAGDKIRLRGYNRTYGSSASRRFSITGSAPHIIYGNMNSMSVGDDYIKGTITGGSRYYAFLFQGNTNLTDASNLYIPNYAVSNFCQNLFYGCTSLTKAPYLGGITLYNGSFNQMFYGCTSLVKAPELPFDGTLPTSAYRNMFNGCSSLNYVKCLATDVTTNATTTQYWLRNVSPTGTFVKNADMYDWGTGDSGIPSGWTIIDD